MTCEEARMVSPLVIPLGSSARFAVSLFLTRLSVPDDEPDSSGARAMSRALANTRCRVRAEPSPSAIGFDEKCLSTSSLRSPLSAGASSWRGLDSCLWVVNQYQHHVLLDFAHC